MAAKKGRFENILGYLIVKGADINIKDNDGVKNTCHYKLVLLMRIASFPGNGENVIN